MAGGKLRLRLLPDVPAWCPATIYKSSRYPSSRTATISSTLRSSRFIGLLFYFYVLVLSMMSLPLPVFDNTTHAPYVTWILALNPLCLLPFLPIVSPYAKSRNHIHLIFLELLQFGLSCLSLECVVQCYLAFLPRSLILFFVFAQKTNQKPENFQHQDNTQKKKKRKGKKVHHYLTSPSDMFVVSYAMLSVRA